MDFTIFIVAMLAIYFAPTLVAWGKPQVGSVFLLNLLLGWSLIGWAIALIWALMRDDTQRFPAARPTDRTPYEGRRYDGGRYDPRDARG